MCGICGFTGEPDRVILKRMTDSIHHRGPDDDGFYADAHVNLGMRRLSIIDPVTGKQPIHSEDGRLWTVFNGEIYNFQTLRKDLEAKGHCFYTDHSDTEVVVHLYETYGEEFPHHLNGMFALALWDKEQEKLLLVRDRMGVKPLFYAYVNGKLLFASEIKAILEHPDYRRDVNYEAVYHYFTLKNIPAPFTAFKGIESLLPGEMLVFERGKITKKKWWTIRFQQMEDQNEEDIQGRILELLENATKLRMISDVPFGAYLSGGVDSSAVVALMTRYSDQPVRTFSLGYEDELKNKEADLYYARKVSQAFGTQHHEYLMSWRELRDDIDKVIGAFDQPFSGTISTFFLSKLISKHVKVALSGDAADELFGSYLSHRVSQPMNHFRRLYDKVLSNTLTQEERELFKPCDIRFLKELYEKSEGEEARWRYRLGVFTDEEKEDFLSVDFKAKLQNTSSYALFMQKFSTATANDPLNRMLEMEWNTQLPDQVLAFVDFLSMAHSVEVRSPFLDYRLVEFAATIPGNMKIRCGNVKDILKRAVGPLIPEGITKRPKEGFVLPIFDWMVDKLKDYSLDVLSATRIGRHGFFNEEKVRHLVNDYYSGNRSCAAKVWNLMMFQVWWGEYFG